MSLLAACFAWYTAQMSPPAQALRRHLEQLGPLPEAAFTALSGELRPCSFARGGYLLRGGERATLCFFVVEGLVRELYLDDTGCEHVRSFVHEGQLTGSLLDLISGAPSVTWIEALEPTQALAFRYDHFDALCERFPALQRIARRFAEALFVKKARREHDMLAYSARERYARFCAEHAALDARVRRQHLASYLGITPEHLSRLRRRA